MSGTETKGKSPSTQKDYKSVCVCVCVCVCVFKSRIFQLLKKIWILMSEKGLLKRKQTGYS